MISHKKTLEARFLVAESEAEAEPVLNRGVAEAESEAEAEPVLNRGERLDGEQLHGEQLDWQKVSSNLINMLDISCEEDAIRKINGVTCVEPSVGFLHDSAMNWVNCCYAIPDSAVCFKFNMIKEHALSKFSSLGLINVFSHFGGFLVFRFRDSNGVNQFLRNSPVTIENCVFKVKPWHEYFPVISVNEKMRVWVRFSRVPFLYWTVKGLCLLGSAVGKLVGMDRVTHRAAVRNEPILEARMLIEVGVLDPPQTHILVDAYAVDRKTKVLVTYERASICGYCCDVHSGACDLLQECFLDAGEEPQPFRLFQEDSGTSMYRDKVNSSDGDVESSRLENAEFELDSAFDYEDWFNSMETNDRFEVANEGHHKRKRDQGNSGLVAGTSARAETGADAGVSPSAKQNDS